MFLLLALACGTSSKDDTGPTGTSAAYHPAGFAAAEVHGLEAKMQTQVCTSCHGEDLTGGTAGVSCDACHASGWKSDCTFCHGGTENSTGAPPEDIDDSTTDISFPEHGAHVTETIHSAFDCVQCHTKPTDAMSSGHLFVGDTTAGAAEMNFLDGLSPAGTYSTSAGCDNLYCHGNGQEGNTGDAHSGETSSCTMCHADARSGRSLSGEHGEHVGRFDCDECHGTTVTGSDTISTPANHVNGVRDLDLPAGIEYNNGRCDGDCHGEDHRGRNWD